MEHSRTFLLLSWALRLVAAVILLQTLFFKFSGAKESVYIFSSIGMEPWGRYGTGVIELFASALLLLPATVPYGAILALGTMSGAIFFHLTKLGIALAPVGDNGELFALALVVFTCSLALLVMHREQVPVLGKLVA